jgi:hypothetical protein
MAYFPNDFLLGAATAAHQVEGNNTKSDFWAMEQVPGSMFKEPSGICVDHYNRYREDIDLLAGAGLPLTTATGSSSCAGLLRVSSVALTAGCRQKAIAAGHCLITLNGSRVSPLPSAS